MLHAVLLEGMDDFVALENSWDELARSVEGVHYTQTFQWARLGWEMKTPAVGDALFCATVWSGERLVAIWPFQRTRLGISWRLEPLGCGMHEEYGDPLIASDVDALNVCAELLALLECKADLIEIPFVRCGGPMQAVLAKAGALSVVRPLTAYVLEKKADHFDAVLKTYSANFRAGLKQKRKRLQKLGRLEFDLPEDDRICRETIEWVLAEKRQWLKRQHKQNPWLGSDETQRFFNAAAMNRSEFGRAGFFRLTLNGKPIAAFITSIDHTRVEMLVTSFSHEYGRFSPGMLIIEDVARWCFERNLDFDMRPLHMDYKVRWANGTVDHLKYRTAFNANGAITILPDYVKQALRRLLRSILKVEHRDAIRHIMDKRHNLTLRRKNHVMASALPAAGEE